MQPFSLQPKLCFAKPSTRPISSHPLTNRTPKQTNRVLGIPAVMSPPGKKACGGAWNLGSPGFTGKKWIQRGIHHIHPGLSRQAAVDRVSSCHILVAPKGSGKEPRHTGEPNWQWHYWSYCSKKLDTNMLDLNWLKHVESKRLWEYDEFRSFFRNNMCFMFTNVHR